MIKPIKKWGWLTMARIETDCDIDLKKKKPQDVSCLARKSLNFSVASVSRGNYFLSRSGANSIHRSWLFIQDQSWRSRIFPAFHWIETHRISSKCKYLWVTPLYASEISLSWYPRRQQKYFFLERLWAILKFRAFDISLSCALVDFSWSFIVGKKTTVGTWKSFPRRFAFSTNQLGFLLST